MEEINVNEVCNEAGKMRKFFKAFSQIDEVLIAYQNSDTVLKQLRKQCAEKESELAGLNDKIAVAHTDISNLGAAVVKARVEAEDMKAKEETNLKVVKSLLDVQIKQVKELADKEIMEIRAGVKQERQAGNELVKSLKAKQEDAIKLHDAIMEGLMAEEAALQNKIQQSRDILESLKAKVLEM